jgi:hypothetical protein
MNADARLLCKYGRSVPSTRRSRRLALELNRLEGRLLLATDMTAPVTTATVVSGTPGDNGFFKTPITVDLNASDPDSPTGLSTSFSIDGGSFVSGNTLTLGDGVHTVRFFSVDPSGNREATESATFKVDTTVPVVTASASPTSLWPPNHKMVSVHVTGTVTDASGGVPGSVSFHVVDEYGKVQPAGTATVDANGNYSFNVSLQSSRLGQDKDGRQYRIIVTATDQAGNTGSAMSRVTVPHDQGHRGGGGGGTGHRGNGGGGNHGHGNHGHGGHGHGIVLGHGHNNQGNGNHGHGGKHGHG